MGSAGMFFHCRLLCIFRRSRPKIWIHGDFGGLGVCGYVLRIHGDKLFDEAAAGGGYESQFAAVVREGRSKHSRFLEQVAIEVKRRDHVAGVVCDLRDAFAMMAQGRKDLHDLVDLLLLCLPQFRQLFKLRHV